MIIVMVRIPVSSDEQAEGIINRFKHREGKADTLPGFAGFQLMRGEGELVSMTRWKTRADLDRWMSSQAHSQVHSHPGGGPSGRNDAMHQAPPGMSGNVSVYEVIIPGEGDS
jgi:heme-degrading monooxygenase HmoA